MHSISMDVFFLITSLGTLAFTGILFIIAGKNPGNKQLLLIVAFLYLLVDLILPLIIGPIYLAENKKEDQIPWFYGLIVMFRVAELFFAKGIRTFLVLWKNPKNYVP
jgi:hypothetical protein